LQPRLPARAKESRQFGKEIHVVIDPLSKRPAGSAAAPDNSRSARRSRLTQTADLSPSPRATGTMRHSMLVMRARRVPAMGDVLWRRAPRCIGACRRGERFTFQCLRRKRRLIVAFNPAASRDARSRLSMTLPRVA
jgi:hypothetical protein